MNSALAPNPNLPNLHDAILESIEVDWPDGTATLRFRPVDPASPVVLLFAGLAEIHVPHDEPWGPSISVNTIEYVDSGDPDDLGLRVEMQSGDCITLRANRLTVS